MSAMGLDFSGSDLPLAKDWRFPVQTTETRPRKLQTHRSRATLRGAGPGPPSVAAGLIFQMRRSADRPPDAATPLQGEGCLKNNVSPKHVFGSQPGYDGYDKGEYNHGR